MRRDVAGVAQSDVTTSAQPWRVGLFLAGAQPDLHEARAIEFCSRGTTVDLVGVAAGAAMPDDLDAVFHLHPGARVQPDVAVPVMRLTDVEGALLSESPAFTRKIRKGAPAIEVQVRDGLGSVLARGIVSTRRDIELTRLHAWKVAGPLLVIAARHLPLPFVPAQPPTAAVVATPGERRVANIAANARFLARTATRAVTVRQWRVARVPGDDPLTALVVDHRRAGEPLDWVAAPAPDFWADPFVLQGDPPLLFVEELQMSTGRGVIRVLEVAGRELIPRDVVLRTDHHLSFPQVYRTRHGWLATVETCGRRNPIYTFDVPGGRWRPTTLPHLPPHLGDPVLTIDQDGEVTGVVGTDAQTDSDSVVVRYWLDRDLEQWRRDDASVRVNAINGRGGGTLDLVRRWRATQDCTGTYGRAVEVVAAPSDAPPRTVARIDAATVGRGTDGRRSAGVHTLTWTPDGSQVWLDGWRRRPTPLGWWWDVRERSHLNSCHG